MAHGNGGNYEAGKRNGNRGCVPDAAWFWNLYGNRNVSYVPGWGRGI